MVNFQIPNPADIADGQFLQWNAAQGRFLAVDAPDGGGVEITPLFVTEPQDPIPDPPEIPAGFQTVMSFPAGTLIIHAVASIDVSNPGDLEVVVTAGLAVYNQMLVVLEARDTFATMTRFQFEAPQTDITISIAYGANSANNTLLQGCATLTFIPAEA